MRSLYLILVVVSYTGALAQDSIDTRFQVKGYVKDLQSLSFGDDLSGPVTGNLIHHRLNVRWHPKEGMTGAVEIRNRLFWCEEIALVPDAARDFGTGNEAVDLTWNVFERERIILNTTIDRLWFEYSRDKWNVRIGRQRVNWGIGTTWNPNDLFNTFNFLDFDYEERPGVDGLKFQYLTGGMDYLETAVSFGKSFRETVAALRYFRNVANYDLQFIAGIFLQQPTVGFGWSGSIRETGFKGELQYFFRERGNDPLLNASLEADHVFSKGWYLNAGLFLNTTGATSSDDLFVITDMQFSPRKLMPTRWNTSITFSKELSPLIAIATTVVYSPNANLTILLPTVTYSATENLDINLVWQSFFMEQRESFGDVAHRCFLRFKWSY